MLTTLIPANTKNEFALDVRRGMQKKPQKELPSKYFYDAIGSALFEVISQLPEYGAGGGCRARQRDRQEDALRVGGPLRQTTDLLSSDRDFAKRFGRLRAGVE